MFYVDTSVVVTAIAREAATSRAQAWLYGQAAQSLSISDWVITEVSSALSIKLRTGQIDVGHRSHMLVTFNRLVAETFTVIEVRRPQFHTAARFADIHDAKVRASDALHLAIAFDRGLTLCTLDQKMGEAGPLLGVSTLLI